MTQDKTPSDAEIAALYADETGFALGDSPAALLDFARAVLAKWGSPVVAGEPVAWYEYNADLDAWFLAYSHNPKAKTRPLVFGDTTPQPTQAQAGAVLDLNAAAKKLAERMDYPWEHMPEQGRAEMRKHALAVINAARGIKGGQHGTE